MRLLTIARRYCLFIGLFALSSQVFANTLTDVGLGPVPDFDPNQGTTWALSSSCVDINESGQAACQSQAMGPTYGCGWRNAQSCSSKVKLVHQWGGASLLLMSGPGADYDVPLVMNNNGAIGGYAYSGEVYPSEGGNGRIWRMAGSPEAKPSVVRSLNDDGDYVLEWFDNPGGINHYTSTGFRVDDTPLIFPGNFVRPFVIGNGGHVIGAQIIQSFVQDIHSPTGDEIPEVSGVGWLLSQQQVDALPINEAGLYDIDGDIIWPSLFYRPIGFTSYQTTVSDVNDLGEFVVRTQFGGLFSSKVCSQLASSEVSDVYGNVSTVPWTCASSNYTGGTYAGGKGFQGINGIGDAVGSFTPGAYSYQTTYPTHPWVWLKNSRGAWDEYNANDLLPADSGYTIVNVQDINNARQIVGTCKNIDTEQVTGCILDLTDHPVPTKLARPTVGIDSPASGESVSGIVTISASAWDRDGSVNRVVFKVGSRRIGVVRNAPYQLDWDTSELAPGSHKLKAIAIDDEGNRRAAKVTVVAADNVPGPIGEVEGEGTVTAFGDGYVEIDGVVLSYSASTVIKFNDVPDFAVGLPIQYKAERLEDGSIRASVLEVN